MSKKTDKQMEQINSFYAQKREERNQVYAAIDKRIADAEAELASLDGTEFLALSSGNDDELDSILAKRESLNRRINLLKEQKKQNGNAADADSYKRIYVDTGILDNDSEKEACEELRPLLEKIAQIIAERERVRSFVITTRNSAAHTFNNPADSPVDMSLASQNNAVLSLRNDLLRCKGYKDIAQPPETLAAYA